MKKKVLHITFNMRTGGTEQIIRSIINSENTDSLDMSIFCIEEPIGPWAIELQKNGTKVTSTQRSPGFDFKLITTIRKHIQKEKIDILHCHQYTPYVYGVIAAIFTPTRVIFTEHGRTYYPDRSSWKRKISNPILERFTDVITVISEATKQALVTYEAFKSNRIEVIYNGIKDQSTIHFDTSATKKKLDIASNEIIFGTISRLHPIKNQIMMLKSFAQLSKKHQRCKLLIVGDGEMRPQLEELSRALDTTNNVLFTGYCASPQKYLDIIDVFLLPSFSEGTSLTLLESMSFSKPSIVTDVGGNPEIVVDNETGLIIPNDDCDALLQKMALMLDPELRSHLGTKAKHRFDMLFSLDRMLDSYRKIYNKMSDKG